MASWGYLKRIAGLATEHLHGPKEHHSPKKNRLCNESSPVSDRAQQFEAVLAHVNDSIALDTERLRISFCLAIHNRCNLYHSASVTRRQIASTRLSQETCCSIAVRAASVNACPFPAIAAATPSRNASAVPATVT